MSLDNFNCIKACFSFAISLLAPAHTRLLSWLLVTSHVSHLCLCFQVIFSTLHDQTRFAFWPASQCKSCWVTACERGIQAQFVLLYFFTFQEDVHLKNLAFNGGLLPDCNFVLNKFVHTIYSVVIPSGAAYHRVLTPWIGILLDFTTDMMENLSCLFYHSTKYILDFCMNDGGMTSSLMRAVSMVTPGNSVCNLRVPPGCLQINFTLEHVFMFFCCPVCISFVILVAVLSTVNTKA